MRTSKTHISPVLNCNLNELSAGVAETSQPGLRDVCCVGRGPLGGKIDGKRMRSFGRHEGGTSGQNCFLMLSSVSNSQCYSNDVVYNPPKNNQKWLKE